MKPLLDSEAGSDVVVFESVSAFMLPVLLPRFLGEMIMGIVSVVLPLQVLDWSDSDSLVGSLITCQGVGLFIFNYPAGRLISLYGPRAVTIGATLGTVAGSAIFALAPQGPLGVGMLAIGAFVLGCADAATMTAAVVYVTATAKHDIRGMAMSTLGATKRWGMFLGPAIGGFTAKHFNHSAAYTVQTAIAVLTLVWTFWFMIYARPNQEIGERAPGEVSRPESSCTAMELFKKHAHVMLSVGLFVACLTGVRRARVLLMPITGHALDMSEDYVGYLMTVSYAVDSFLFPMAGWLLDNAGRNKTGALSAFAFVVAFLCLWLENKYSMLLFAILSGLANGFSSGIVMAMTSDLAPPNARGTFVGLFRTGGRVAEVISPLLVGFVAENCSLSASVLLMAVLAGFGGIWVLCCIQEIRPA